MKKNTPEVPQASLFDGKVCCRCHTWRSLREFNKSKRTSDGLNAHCKECDHAHYLKHRENQLAKCKQRYAENAESIKARVIAYAHKNRAKVSASDRAYRAKNRDEYNTKHRILTRNRRHRDPEAYREWERKNRQANPERETERNKKWNYRRRARLKGLSEHHTHEEWLALCECYESRCLRCGEIKPLTRDHVLPLTMGGADTIDNIQPLCQSCNSWKNNRHIDFRPDMSAGKEPGNA